MKMTEAHVVSLSAVAVKILRELRRRHTTLHGKVAADHLVFSLTKGKPISDMTMLKVLRDMKVENATVHGFRSTFTDWVAECTNVPREPLFSIIEAVTDPNTVSRFIAFCIESADQLAVQRFANIA